MNCDIAKTGNRGPIDFREPIGKIARYPRSRLTDYRQFVQDRTAYEIACKEFILCHAREKPVNRNCGLHNISQIKLFMPHTTTLNSLALLV